MRHTQAPQSKSDLYIAIVETGELISDLGNHTHLYRAKINGHTAGDYWLVDNTYYGDDTMIINVDDLRDMIETKQRHEDDKNRSGMPM